MTEFTPLNAVIGGALLAISALLLLFANGRIAGISGILSNLLPTGSNQKPGSRYWQLAFILGLVASPLMLPLITSIGITAALPGTISIDWFGILAGGFFVGLGAAYGSGCTSGHGICGIGRLSPRSVVATSVFMLVAVVMVFSLKLIKGA